METQKKFQEGLLGRKMGMTQIFADDGTCIPVTALEVGPCYVLQVKTPENDGYSAVQLGFAPRRMDRVDKPQAGHFTKAGSGAFYHVSEVRCDVQGLGWGETGKEISAADVFQAGDFVDVSGTSKGRGFQGVVKRFRVKGQPASRGTHESFRNIGSIGMRKFPGRVWKNQRMPGHMGDENVCIQNLEVVRVSDDGSIVFVKGGVPGPKGSFITLRKAVKRVSRNAKAA